MIASPKFLFFDLGIVSHLTRRGTIKEGSELFGRAFEHFLTLEVIAHSSYSELNYSVSYWRTASQYEVDLILADGKVAIEVKAAALARDRHLKGLRAFKQEHRGDCILVTMDREPRKTSDGILILPWQDFLRRLWANEIVG